MKDISYAAPRTIAEAASLLDDKAERARILAGGTDIIVQVREGRRDIDMLVDIKHIPEVLYHWRKLPTSTAYKGSAKPQAPDVARRALASYLRAVGREGIVEPAPSCNYKLPSPSRAARLFPCSRKGRWT